MTSTFATKTMEGIWNGKWLRAMRKLHYPHLLQLHDLNYYLKINYLITFLKTRSEMYSKA
jgi:hypothetical protein